MYMSELNLAASAPKQARPKAKRLNKTVGPLQKQLLKVKQPNKHTHIPFETPHGPHGADLLSDSWHSPHPQKKGRAYNMRCCATSIATRSFSPGSATDTEREWSSEKKKSKTIHMFKVRMRLPSRVCSLLSWFVQKSMGSGKPMLIYVYTIVYFHPMLVRSTVERIT